jgi:hypothetical protein
MLADVRRISVLFLGVAIALGAASARAQGDAAGAKAAFSRGSALFDKGDFVGASDAFREANRLNPSWKLYYNIGQAEAAAKRYGLALEAFERYLAEGGDEIAPDRNEEVIAEIKRLRELVGSLDIQAPAGSVVFVDDQERGPAPLPGVVKVAAGVDHEIRAEEDGAAVATRTVRVSGGDTLVVDLGGAAEGPSPADGSAAAPTEGGSSALAKGGWALVGGGAAVVIAGVVTGVLAYKKDEILYDACSNGVCPDTADYRSDIDSMKAMAAVTDVLLFVGGAAVATGAALLIADKVRGKGDEEPVSVSPVAGPGYGGAVIAGRF